MEIKIEGEITPLVQDFYWLTQNENFLNHVNKIRRSYKIPSIGFIEKEIFIKWDKQLGLQDKLDLQANISSIRENISFSGDKDTAILPLLINNYVYFNKIINPYKHNSISIPSVKLEKDKMGTTLTIKFTNDTPMNDIYTAIDNAINNKTKPFDNKLNKGMVDFETNKKIWELKQQNKKYKEIGEITGYEYYQIGPKLKFIKERIAKLWLSNQKFS